MQELVWLHFLNNFSSSEIPVIYSINVQNLKSFKAYNNFQVPGLYPIL